MPIGVQSMAAKIQGTVEERLRAVENFRFLVLGAVGVITLGLSGNLWIFKNLANDVAAQAKDVAVHENRLSTEERTNSDLKAKYDSLRSDHEQLRRNITVLWDR